MSTEYALPIRLGLITVAGVIAVIAAARSRFPTVSGWLWWIGGISTVFTAVGAGALAVVNPQASIALGFLLGAILQIIAASNDRTGPFPVPTIRNQAHRDYVESLGWALVIVANGATLYIEMRKLGWTF